MLEILFLQFCRFLFLQLQLTQNVFPLMRFLILEKAKSHVERDLANTGGGGGGGGGHRTYAMSYATRCRRKHAKTRPVCGRARPVGVGLARELRHGRPSFRFARAQRLGESSSSFVRRALAIQFRRPSRPSYARPNRTRSRRALLIAVGFFPVRFRSSFRRAKDDRPYTYVYIHTSLPSSVRVRCPSPAVRFCPPTCRSPAVLLATCYRNRVARVFLPTGTRDFPTGKSGNGRTLRSPPPSPPPSSSSPPSSPFHRAKVRHHHYSRVRTSIGFVFFGIVERVTFYNDIIDCFSRPQRRQHVETRSSYGPFYVSDSDYTM